MLTCDSFLCVDSYAYLLYAVGWILTAMRPARWPFGGSVPAVLLWTVQSLARGNRALFKLTPTPAVRLPFHNPYFIPSPVCLTLWTGGVKKIVVFYTSVDDFSVRGRMARTVSSPKAGVPRYGWTCTMCAFYTYICDQLAREEAQALEAGTSRLRGAGTERARTLERVRLQVLAYHI